MKHTLISSCPPRLHHQSTKRTLPVIASTDFSGRVPALQLSVRIKALTFVKHLAPAFNIAVKDWATVEATNFPRSVPVWIFFHAKHTISVQNTLL